MPKRVIDYTNNFESELTGTSSTSTGTGVGLANATGSGDPDGEYVFFSGSGERARLEVSADLAADERINAFEMTMQLDINGTSGPFGNGQADGVSFSLTDPASIPTSPSDAYEYGSPTGLVVQVLPYTWDGNGGNAMQIVWNGDILASTSLGAVGVSQAAQELSISVDRAGAVSVSWGSDITLDATIPRGEWATVDQENWNFVVAGRSGSNGGEAYIDDLTIEAEVACFTRGTQIDTYQGERLVEDLQIGDLVWTLDAGYQAVRWIGEQRLNARDLAQAPQLRPIRIVAGALGAGTPSRDLLVSPQHRVLLRSKIAERMFGKKEVLVAAKQLLCIDGIEQTDAELVDYVHFLCDEHQIVRSNGALTESMYAGTEAIKSVSDAAREEILTLFPTVCDDLDAMAPARLLVPGRKARNLAARHSTNSQYLVDNSRQ